MSIYHMWDSKSPNAKLKSSLSSNWTRIGSTLAHPDNEDTVPKILTVADEITYADMDSKEFKGENYIHIETNSDNGKNDDQILQVEDKISRNKIAQIGQEKIDYIQLAQEPWPEDAQLFQPYEAEQILLPDNASCLAVQAYLKMCSLPFAVKMRWNAEWLCAGVAGEGRVPVLRCGAFVATELEGAAELVARRGLAPASRLEPGQRADMRAYMALVSNVLLNAELYVSWLHKETYMSVSRVRCGAVFPWPLSWLQVRARRHRALQRLRAYKWHEHTLEQVLSDVDKCCATLSERLGDQEYFFGVQPTQLDALVFGHMVAMLIAQPSTILLPRGAESLPLALLRHTKLIASTFFTDNTLLQTALKMAFQGANVPQEQAAGDVLGPISHLPCPQTPYKSDQKSQHTPSCRDEHTKQYMGIDKVEESTKKTSITCDHTDVTEDEWVAEYKVADWISRCGDNFHSENPKSKVLCDIPEHVEDNNSDAVTKQSIFTSAGFLYEGMERKSSMSREVLLSVEEMEQMEQMMNETGVTVENLSTCSATRTSDTKVDNMTEGDNESVDSQMDEAEAESENENANGCNNDNKNMLRKKMSSPDEVLIEESNEGDELKTNATKLEDDLIKDYASVSDTNENYDVPSEDWEKRYESEMLGGVDGLCKSIVNDCKYSPDTDKEKTISRPASKIPMMKKKLK